MCVTLNSRRKSLPGQLKWNILKLIDGRADDEKLRRKCLRAILNAEQLMLTSGVFNQIVNAFQAFAIPIPVDAEFL